MARLRAIRDNILCINGDFDESVTEGGIIIGKTIGTTDGITPRWFEVFEVGPEIDWLQSGQWVYVEYGRWTEKMELKDDRFEDGRGDVWKVDPQGCLAVADSKQKALNLAGDDVVTAQKKELI